MGIRNVGTLVIVLCAERLCGEDVYIEVNEERE